MNWKINKEYYDSYGYVSVEEDGFTLTFDDILEYYTPFSIDKSSVYISKDRDKTLPYWWTLA